MWMKGMSLKKAAQVIWVKTNIGEIWDTRTTIILSCQQSLTLMATILTTCKFHGQRNQQRDQSHTQNLQRGHIQKHQRGHIQKHQRGHIAKLQRNLTRLLSPELKNQEKPPGSQLRPLKRWQHSSPQPWPAVSVNAWSNVRRMVSYQGSPLTLLIPPHLQPQL